MYTFVNVSYLFDLCHYFYYLLYSGLNIFMDHFYLNYFF